MSAAFGAQAPSGAQERIRRLAHRLPTNYAGRKLASLLLGPAGGRSGRAFDVEIFGSQKARLHPHDNICEKRVYMTPQLWDGEERALLAQAIAAHRGDEFIFADIGANVGLYTLFARSAAGAAGKRLRAICVEPDADMRARLAFNSAASGAGDDIAIYPYAAAADDGPVRFAVNRQSRGLSRIDAAGALEVQGRTLPSILGEACLTRADAMKIDIEGHEFAALGAFFRDAPQTLWPRLIVLEISHEAPDRSAAALCLSLGYAAALTTKRNAVLERSTRPTAATRNNNREPSAFHRRRS